MTRPGDTTRELFERMDAGDRQAFDEYFTRHSARVLVYINYNLGARLRRKLDPADILQNLYVRVFQDFEAFRRQVEERGSNPTLVRMADHEITEAYRYHFKVGKRDARREITAAYLKTESGDSPSLLDWIPGDATSITARVVLQEEYQRVMSMLEQLSPLEQYVTVARIIEGIPAREIAERLGKSRGAVKMIVARTREKLRKRAAADEEEKRERREKREGEDRG